MKGYLKLEATNTSDDMTRLSIECEMEDVGLTDKLQILRSVCMALKIDHEVVKFFVTLDKTGMLEPTEEDIQSEDFDDDDDDNAVDALLKVLFGGLKNEG